MKLPVWRRRREQELDEEIEAHLRMAARDRVERGEAPDEAMAAARREFGNVGLVKEVTRDMWGWRWLEQFLRDVRLSFRFMARTPGVTAVLVLTLALGIGANTAIFTIVNAVLIEPLPFRDPDRLVVVWEQNDRRPANPNVVAPANLLRWQARATVFERIAALYDFRTDLSGSGDPEELIGQAVSPEFFPALGVSPQIGRAFAPAEGADHFSGHDRVTVISHELWQRRFGGDPGVVGRTIRLGGDPVTIVGVMPPDTRLFLKAGSLVGKPPDLWLQFQYPASWHTPRGRFLSAIARLKPGVSLERAQAQMDTIARGLTAEWPDFDTGWTVRLVPLHTEIAGELRPALLVLAGAVGFVLLIACANVANLLLARGAARRREFAIRTALGAGRGQVVRQLLTETLVLSLLGGAAGILVARLGTAFLLALSPVDLTGLGHVRLSLGVLGFTAAVSFATVVICGFAPAFDASRSYTHDALKEGARLVGSAPRSRRLRQAFVVSEVALAVVLLVGAGLLVRSFLSLRAVSPGFDPQSVLTMRVTLPPNAYQDAAQRTRFFREAVQRLGAIPGVRAAGAISFLPFAGLGAATSFTIEGRPAPAAGQSPVADVRVCDNGYFRAMRIPLVAGRLFTEREMLEKADVVVVNAELVRQHFPNEDPLGKRLVIHMNDPNVPTTIIGVVGDVRHVDLATGVRAMTYWPHPQLPYSAMTFAVRTDVDPVSVAAAAERAIRGLDPNQPVSDVRSMDQWIAKSLARARFSWAVLAVFGAFALLLTSIGIYGVIAYSVGQRTSEIGVRVALGAARRDVVSMVVRQGLELTAVGLAVGVLLAFLLGRTLSALLFGIGGADRVAFAGAVAILGGVALVASYLPARRAARVDPVTALRQE